LKLAIIIAAVLLLVVHHYLFSFQRFTLAIARKHASPEASVTEIQLLISPTVLGLFSWLVTVLGISAAVSLGIRVSLVGRSVVLRLRYFVLSVLPLFPLKTHFASLAQSALTRQYLVDSDLRTRLTIDIIRAGAGHSI